MSAQPTTAQEEPWPNAPPNQRSAPRGKPRSRPQLDAATILDAALRLSQDGTPKPLTVRRLGNELGADPTAIYRHFRDKDELLKAVLDRLIADSVAKVDPATGWRERMTQLATASVDIFTDHPASGLLPVSRPPAVRVSSQRSR